MVKLGISGACGRMGQRIIACAQANKNAQVVFGLEYSGCPAIGLSNNGIMVTADPNIIKTCEVLIDFSSPEAVIDHLDYALKFKKPIVIGVTGINPQQLKKIKAAAKKIPVIYSSNMSLGVNVVFKLLDIASGILSQYAVSVQEAHHVHKKDAPSGTAKTLADIINKYGFDLQYQDIKSIREGEIVGDHKIVFDSALDTIEISHHAKTRDIFASGAVVAGVWIKGKKPGLYSMADVLFGKK